MLSIPVAAENVPFSFDLKHGGQELRPAPLAYITNLPDTIFHLLDEKKRLKQSELFFIILLLILNNQKKTNK